MSYPQFDKTFMLDTDASDSAIGAVLSQQHADGELVISFASRALTKAERKYSMTRKELLALVYFVQYFRHYLCGRQFVVRTDHRALQWLRSFKEPEGQIAWWLELLEEYHFEVCHRPGTKHSNADALSRSPHRLIEDDDAPPDLPEVTEIFAVERQTLDNDGRHEHGQWFPGMSNQQLQDAQKADATIGQILQWMSLGNRPDQNTVSGSTVQVRSLWAQWGQLVLQEGLLYRRWESPDGRQAHLQLIVPLSHTQDVLRALHNDPSSGHLGYHKTVDRVRRRFYWPGLTRDVEEWCKRCDRCGSRKAITPTRRAPLLTSRVGYPMERVAMDVLGPLPVSNRNNKYIVIIGDYYTKWVEVFPLPNQEAKTVARVFFDEFVCRFGTPTFLHTDKGRNWESALFKELCLLLNVKKTRTSPYHPQSDGFVERFNRTLEHMLSMYVNDNQNDWDDHLQHVMLAYRSSVQETTGYTPHFLMTGREVSLPVDLMFGHIPEPARPVPEHVAHVRKSLQAAYELVQQTTQVHQRRQKDCYDRRVHGSAYTEGDRVWLHIPWTKRGRSRKLHRPWQGPYRITKKLSDVTYRIQSLKGRKRHVVHFNRLKPYIDPVNKETSDTDTIVPSSSQQHHEGSLLPEQQNIDATTDDEHTARDATADLYSEDVDILDCPDNRRHQPPSQRESESQTHNPDGPSATLTDPSSPPNQPQQEDQEPPESPSEDSLTAATSEPLSAPPLTEARTERARRAPAWTRD